MQLSDILQVTKQRFDIAFRHPIASHKKLHREIVKQLVERRLGTTLLEHDCLPLRFTLAAPAWLRPYSSSNFNVAPHRPQRKSLKSSETAPAMSPPTKAATAQRYRIRCRLWLGPRIPTKI